MEPSHVLRAMAVPAEALRGAIRLSLSRETTQEEVDQVLQILRPSFPISGPCRRPDLTRSRASDPRQALPAPTLP